MSIRRHAVGSALSRALLGIAAVVGPTEAAPAGDPFAGGNLSKHLSGPGAEADRSLVGKVVPLQYVGYKCKDYKNSPRHVLGMQSKHAAGSNFAVVFSHVQGMGYGACEYFATKASEVSVYADMNRPQAAWKNRTPTGYLFDHCGQIVGRGKAAQFLEQIDEFVAAVPSRGLPSLFGDFQVDALVREEKALADPATRAAPTLVELRRVANTQESAANEAKRLVAHVENWLAAEPARMEFVAECDLAAAAVQAVEFLRRFKGTGAAVEQRVRTLKFVPQGERGGVGLPRCVSRAGSRFGGTGEGQAAGYLSARLALERFERNAADAPDVRDGAGVLLARAK